MLIHPTVSHKAGLSWRTRLHRTDPFHTARTYCNKRTSHLVEIILEHCYSHGAASLDMAADVYIIAPPAKDLWLGHGGKTISPLKMVMWQLKSCGDLVSHINVYQRKGTKRHETSQQHQQPDIAQEISCNKCTNRRWKQLLRSQSFYDIERTQRLGP